MNCDPLALGDAPEVPLTFGDEGSDIGSAAEASAMGGTLSSGQYVADEVEIASTMYNATLLSTFVMGSAAGRVELTPSNSTSGAARLTVAINATALGSAVDETLSGAGTYMIGTDNGITIDDSACGSGSATALPELFYTADGSGVTLWTTDTVSGIMADVKIHIHQ